MKVKSASLETTRNQETTKRYEIVFIGNPGALFCNGTNTGGVTINNGMTITNGGGDALTILSYSGNGLNVSGAGTGHGIISTGGDSDAGEQ